ncbi:phage tail protein [Streptomyces sp. NPDC004324]
MSDDVTITVRVGDHTAAGFRDIDGRLRTLDGRFAASAGSMSRSSGRAQGALGDLKASLLSLAPAAVPVAASFAPIIANAGGATLAVGAFGAAVAGQIGNLSDASKAQTKYTDSVAQYGRGSKQASEAAQSVQTTLASMPQATARAAVALSTLKDGFHSWSDSLAGVTMAPVEKSFAVLGQLLPKLTPMAQGAAVQMDRLVTVAGGAINTSGFDVLSKKVSDFANSALKKATDGAIHFGRVMSEGNAHGPMTEFMDYARQQGPAVKDLLTNLADAAGNIAQGAAQAGPGLLSIVNALAKMASAVPPEMIGRLMQMYAAFKLIKLAGAGIATVAGGITRLSGSLTTLRAASVAAGGGLAGLRAAFMTLGTATKATVVVAGIAAAVAIIGKLSSMGKQAPPDVDKLTSALARLGSTGKVTGEAASKFGTNFETLKSQMDKVLDPSIAESVNNWGHSVSGGLLKGGDASEELTGSFKAIDQSLADLVKGGKAQLAGAALQDMLSKMSPEQAAKLQGSIGKYKDALADQADEARLAAQSMGIFGVAAQATQEKLAGQQAAADGLRQSIQALSEAHRNAYDAETKFEGAIDSVAKSLKDNGKTLDIHTEKGRANRDALSQMASATEEAAAQARANNESWSKVSGIYDRGRKSIVDAATAITGNRAEAEKLASTLLTMPSPKMKLEMRTDDAITGLNSVIGAMRKTPSSKSVTVRALTGDAVSMLRDLGFKVTRLKDGRFRITADTGSAKANIAAVQRARDALKSKSITLSARDAASAQARAIQRAINSVRGKTVTISVVQHTAGIEGMAGRNARNYRASGGLAPGYAGGGPVVQTHPDGGLIQGPGTGTSDSVIELSPNGGVYRTSNREYIVKEASVRKYGVGFLDAVNSGRLKLAGFAKGGLTQAEKDARSSLRGQFGISAFGRAAGYQRTPFEKAVGAPSDLSSLVTSLNQARGEIKAGTRGGTESRLLKQLDSVGKSLIRYDKQLNAVNKSLETAKSKLSDLKNSASQLSDSVKSGVLSSSNITKGASGDGPVTVASIMGSAVQSRDKAQALAGALAGLKSKGLDKGLIQDIAQAGVEGGGLETAGALMSASASEISSLNTLRSQTVTYAGRAGATTSDAVYGAAIKAQTATVAKLQKSQDKLEKSMAHLAKVMEKSISKAIGKKAAGGIVGAAASGGLRGGLTWVGEHEPELLDLPVGSRVWSGPDSRRKAAAPWDSMLNVPRRGARVGGGAAAGPQEVRVVLELKAGDSSRRTEELLSELRGAIKVRGGDVQGVLGNGRSR